jgi:hypothetical protein
MIPLHFVNTSYVIGVLICLKLRHFNSPKNVNSFINAHIKTAEPNFLSDIYIYIYTKCEVIQWHILCFELNHLENLESLYDERDYLAKVILRVMYFLKKIMSALVWRPNLVLSSEIFEEFRVRHWLNMYTYIQMWILHQCDCVHIDLLKMCWEGRK